EPVADLKTLHEGGKHGIEPSGGEGMALAAEFGHLIGPVLQLVATPHRGAGSDEVDSGHNGAGKIGGADQRGGKKAGKRVEGGGNIVEEREDAWGMGLG